MSLESNYLGLSLSNPLLASSSGLTGNINSILALAEAGVGGIVLKSIFEEDINTQTKLEENRYNTNMHPEAELYAHKVSFEHHVHAYIELLRQAKKELSIPIIASMNCSLHGEWLDFSKRLEDEGADALELNLAILPNNVQQSAAEIEKQYGKIVEGVIRKLAIPITVKIGAMFTNPGNLALTLADAGAKGVVLFNRFQNLHVDNEELVKSGLKEGQWLSHSGEKAQVKLWITRLFGELDLDFSATSGIRTGADILELIESGAKAVQVSSAFYLNGPAYASQMLADLSKLVAQRKVISLSDLLGINSRKVLQKDRKYDRDMHYRAISILNQMS